MHQQQTSFSLYWKLQLAGWSAASLYWTYVGYAGTNFSIELAGLHFVADLLIYIAPTHLFRNFSRRNNWHQLSAKQLLPRLIPAIVILGLIFMILTIGKNHLVRSAFEEGYEGVFVDSLRDFGITTFVTGVRLMAIWTLAYYLYQYAQRELKATRESARLALVAKEAQLNNLSAQLNPHFFFNSLNNIKALVLADPQAARRAIDLLSVLLRNSLYDRGTELITVKEEMQLINDYLELEKLRFEDRLNMVIEVEDAVNDTPILPFSIQTLVENSIKHGIAQKKEGGTIHVRVERNDNKLTASVSNPGVLKTSNTGGLGLKNLSERLELQFNGKSAFRLEQYRADLVLATIITPLS